MSRQMNYRSMPVAFALISATLFGIGTSFAKMLIGDIEPIVLAGLLYLGAFLGLSLYAVLRRISRKERGTGPRLDRADAPWIAGATVSGGIVAPICLMTGLTFTTGFAASLLLNLEGLATALIAYIFFRENLGWRFGIAITCMTVAGVLLSWDPSSGALSLTGPFLLIAAGVAWGVDNNLTRHISCKDPVQIAQIKGLVAGTASILIALALGLGVPSDLTLVMAIVLGAVSYGASLVFFIRALQGLGASRTGVFFSLGPFAGAVLSVMLLDEHLGWTMVPAAVLMFAGAMAIFYERHSHWHVHEELTHSHIHSHDDDSHEHRHDVPVAGQHEHEHLHDATSHDHAHWPDVHHRHGHKDDKSE